MLGCSLGCRGDGGAFALVLAWHADLFAWSGTGSLVLDGST